MRGYRVDCLSSSFFTPYLLPPYHPSIDSCYYDFNRLLLTRTRLSTTSIASISHLMCLLERTLGMACIAALERKKKWGNGECVGFVSEASSASGFGVCRRDGSLLFGA